MSEEHGPDLAAQMLNSIERFKRLTAKGMPKMGVGPRILVLLNVINRLGDGGPIMVSKLSEELHVTPAAVTHLTGGMERKGLIIRTPSKEDRRVILISLSPLGIEMLGRFHSKFTSKVQGLREYLGEKDSKELMRLITLTCDYLESEGMEKQSDEEEF